MIIYMKFSFLLFEQVPTESHQFVLVSAQLYHKYLQWRRSLKKNIEGALLLIEKKNIVKKIYKKLNML